MMAQSTGPQQKPEVMNDNSGWPSLTADVCTSTANTAYHEWSHAQQGEIRNWGVNGTAAAVCGVDDVTARDLVNRDAILKQLAVKNGQINRMSVKQLHDKLTDFKLDNRGMKEALRKRLKAHYKRLRLAHLRNLDADVIPPPKYPYLLVIDFEATCQRDDSAYRHEIIEFPIVLIDVTTFKVLDEFHSFVRPHLNPQLTEFCTELTGITQADVDAAPEFTEVISKVEAWREKHGLTAKNKSVVLTDGPWDMSRFMWQQCNSLDIPVPTWCQRWVNIRRSYANWYRCRRSRLSVMLGQLGMSFEGREHSGRDDARNIARVALRMLYDGSSLRINERLLPNGHVETITRRDSSSDSDSDGRTYTVDSAVEGVSTKLNAVSLDTGQSSVTACDEAELEDDVQDLLAYYALQKKRHR